MKRFFLSHVIIFLFFVFWGVSDSMALGLGFSLGTEASGSADYEFEYQNEDIGDVDLDTSSTKFGLVLDTNVSKANIFNYRMEIEKEDFTLEDSAGDEVELDKWNFNHTFGFRIYRNNLIRVWMGPQIRISYATGDSPYFKDWSQFGLGIAPVVGINFNPGSVVSPALSIGYRYEAFVGTNKATVSYYDSYSRRNVTITEDVDYTATSKGLFINLTLLFRINE